MAGDYIYDTAADEFMMAFSATNYDTGEPVSDPRYVRWSATTTDVTDGQPTTYTWYPMHQCSDEEFSRFYSPVNQETELNTKKLQDNGHLYCFDFKAVNFDLKAHSIQATTTLEFTFSSLFVPQESRFTMEVRQAGMKAAYGTSKRC